MKNCFFLSAMFLLFGFSMQAQSLKILPGTSMFQTGDGNNTIYNFEVAFTHDGLEGVTLSAGFINSYNAGMHNGTVPLPDYVKTGEVQRVNRSTPHLTILLGTFGVWNDPALKWLNFNVYFGVLDGRLYNWDSIDGDLVYHDKPALNGIVGRWGVTVGPKFLIAKRFVFTPTFGFEKSFAGINGTPNIRQGLRLSGYYVIGK